MKLRLLALLDPREARLIRFYLSEHLVRTCWYGENACMVPEEVIPVCAELPPCAPNLMSRWNGRGLYAQFDHEHDRWRSDDTIHDLDINIADSDMTIDSTWQLLSIHSYSLNEVVNPMLRPVEFPQTVYKTFSDFHHLMSSSLPGDFRIDDSIAEQLRSIDATIFAAQEKARATPGLFD